MLEPRAAKTRIIAQWNWVFTHDPKLHKAYSVNTHSDDDNPNVSVHGACTHNMSVLVLYVIHYSMSFVCRIPVAAGHPALQPAVRMPPRLAKPTMSEPSLPVPWAAYLDDESGQTYYHNPNTGESTWERPVVPSAMASSPVSTPMAADGAGAVGVATAEGLKAQLLTMVRLLPDRGRDATVGSLPEGEAILEVIRALEPLDPAARNGWMDSEQWAANGQAPWLLRYTSSRTFHLNEGLTGYAYKRPDCATPELLLQLNAPRRGMCTLSEPIVRPGADAAVPGDAMVAECTYDAGANDALRLEARLMRADGRQWSPRDPNAGDEVDLDADKAIRVLYTTRPVFVDPTLLILRSALLDEVVFIWTRQGVVDPPPVALPEGFSSSLGGASSSVLERALAARDAGMDKRAGRPASHTSVGKIGNE